MTITRDQLLDQVLPALPGRYRAVVATAAGAGLRWGERVGLRRRNIDLLRRELQVVEVAVEVAGRVTCKLSEVEGEPAHGAAARLCDRGAGRAPGRLPGRAG